MIAPYYDHAGIQLFNADCLDVMRAMPDGSVDTVVADHPYGVGKAEWDATFTLDWMTEAARVARLALVVMTGTRTLLDFPKSVGDLHYRWMLSIRIVNGMTVGALGFANWIPCLLYSRDGVKLHGNYQDSCEIRIRGTMPNHPSPKPLDAMTWLLSRLPGTSLLDPFTGSGTTLVAAKLLGWTAIGIERETRHCDTTVDRLAQEVLPLEVA